MRRVSLDTCSVRGVSLTTCSVPSFSLNTRMATCPRILRASGHAWPLAPEFSRQVVMHGELPLGGPPKGHPEAKHTEPKKLKSVRFSSGVNPNSNVNKVCPPPSPISGPPKQHSEAKHTKPEKLKSVRFSSGVNPNPKPTCPRILKASCHAWRVAPGEPPKGHPEAKHTEPKKLKSVRFSSGVNPNSNVNKVCPPPSPISGPPKQHSEAKHTKPEKLKSVRFSSGVNPNPKPTCPRILGASGHAWPLAPGFSGQVVMHGHLPQNSQGKWSCMANCP